MNRSSPADGRPVWAFGYCGQQRCRTASRAASPRLTTKPGKKRFRTNIFSYFFVAKAALKHLEEGAAIINPALGHGLPRQPATPGLLRNERSYVSFTRSLPGSGRSGHWPVNGVAPGPIWTPLIPSTFPAEKVKEFGSDVPLRRAGEPPEVAPVLPLPKASNRFVLHERSGAASQRKERSSTGRVTRVGAPSPQPSTICIGKGVDRLVGAFKAQVQKFGLQSVVALWSSRKRGCTAPKSTLRPRKAADYQGGKFKDPAITESGGMTSNTSPNFRNKLH